jgi:putative ABC transport system permease protein
VIILRAIARALEAAQPALAAQVAGDTRLLPIALAISLAACLVFGLLPAVRLSGRDFLASLHGRTAALRTASADYRARDLVVFGEVALAVGLAVWAAMLLTLFAQLRSVHFSFSAERIVAMRIPADTSAVVFERVAAVPGVSRVAIASGMLGGGDRIRFETPQGRVVMLGRVPVGPGFLETLGVPLLEGRNITKSDVSERASAVVVSETAAAQLAPQGRALGMRLRTNIPGAPDAIVIGISRDAVNHGALTRSGLVPAEIYVPLASGTHEVVVLARVETDARMALRAIGEAARAKPGTRPARPVVLADEFRDGDRDSSAVVARLLGVFAILTLLLAASGVFAVIGQSVTERRRELGIHLAIGAAPGRVWWMVVARETRLLAAAIAVGLAFSLGLTRALFAELTTITAMAPSATIGMLMLCVAVAALSCALATWRITRLRPADILRGPS